MRGQARWLILAGAAAAVVVLFFVLRGGDDGADTTGTTTISTTTETTSTETTATTTATAEPTFVNVTVRGGEVLGGPKVYDVPFEQRVILTVTSDLADEVHVHGYDLMKDVAAGGTVKFSFVTTLSGSFEFELEDAHLRLGELSVAPS
jgi:preprotein translocase subunit SecF